MVLIHDRILKIDIYNFEMSQITPEKSLKSNQIYSVVLMQSIQTSAPFVPQFRLTVLVKQEINALTLIFILRNTSFH